MASFLNIQSDWGTSLASYDADYGAENRRWLIVLVWTDGSTSSDPGATPSSVTFGGTQLTLLESGTDAYFTKRTRLSFWGLANPPRSTASISVTGSGGTNNRVAALVVDGVLTTGPEVTADLRYSPTARNSQFEGPRRFRANFGWPLGSTSET